jgi:hypothetical protein
VDNFAAQCCLEGDQGVKGQAGDAPVIGVADATCGRIAKRGAQDADRGGIAALNFKVDGMLCLDG